MINATEWLILGDIIIGEGHQTQKTSYVYIYVKFPKRQICRENADPLVA